MCKAMQDLFDVELYDYRVNEKVQEINRLMFKLHLSLTDAYDVADVAPDIAPDVKMTLGMTP